LISQFLDFYTILCQFFKFSLELNAETHLEKEKPAATHFSPAAQRLSKGHGRAPAGQPSRRPTVGNPPAPMHFAKEGSDFYLIKWSSEALLLQTHVFHKTPRETSPSQSGSPRWPCPRRRGSSRHWTATPAYRVTHWPGEQVDEHRGAESKP
jgi:hypothetical protein